MTEVTDESRREGDSEATISAPPPPAGILKLAGFHRDLCFCLDIALRGLNNLYSWKPPFLILSWGLADHAPIHSYVTKRTHIVWEFILCQEWYSVFYTHYLVDSSPRPHSFNGYLYFPDKETMTLSKKLAKMSPRIPSRVRHELSNSRAHVFDHSGILQVGKPGTPCHMTCSVTSIVSQS